MPDDDRLHSAVYSPSHTPADVKPDPASISAIANGPAIDKLSTPRPAMDTPPPGSAPSSSSLSRNLNQPPPMSHLDQPLSTDTPTSFPMDIDTPSTRASASASNKDDTLSDSNMVDTPGAGTGGGSASTPGANANANANANAGQPHPSVILRIPASARQSSPASSAGKRKRRSEPAPPTPSTRPRRGVTSARNSSPGATSTPASRDGSSVPSSRNTPQPATAPSGHALSIFNDKTSNEVAAEVQTIVGPSAAGRVLRERERNTTPSSSRGRDGLERSGVSASGRGRRVGGSARVANKSTQQQNSANNKGKGKAAPASEHFVNQDFCSVCRGIGRFLCCDGCPRSFHFMCLEPPLRIDELPKEEVWYCRKCKADRTGSKAADVIRAKDKPITTIFKTMAAKLEQDNPQQFRLPQEIRQYFAGVGTGPKGEYMDTESARNKYDRKGMQEERDPLRLRDGKHRPVACYKCGGTSLPSRTPASEPGAQWRHIVSCDICPLHWHLDCLDPPLASMPSAARKWICPAHAEHVMPRRRTVRHGLETVDVDKPGEYNNGNIQVIESEEAPRTAIPHEDMVINNRRYRVPEKVIQLDFWNRLEARRKRKRGPIEAPAMKEHKIKKAYQNVRRATRQDLDAAELLLGIKFNGPASSDVDGSPSRGYAPLAPQPPPAKPGQMPVKRNSLAGGKKASLGAQAAKGAAAASKDAASANAGVNAGVSNKGSASPGGGAKENGAGPKIKLRVGK